MTRRQIRLAAFAIPLLLAGCKPTTPAPAITGTYTLAYRELQDGSRQQPPMVDGLMTFTDGYHNLNVMEHDAEGRLVVLSEVSSYSVTDSVYRQHVRYSVSSTPGTTVPPNTETNVDDSTPLAIGRDGSISFLKPVDGVRLAFTADSLTATMAGVFVDHWARVRTER